MKHNITETAITIGLYGFKDITKCGVAKEIYRGKVCTAAILPLQMEGDL